MYIIITVKLSFSILLSWIQLLKQNDLTYIKNDK